ncbi:hypothetical protein J7E62_24005 [Variovorax paradoxus]|nr:hypothetical protein [Variovorax paradoxus]
MQVRSLTGARCRQTLLSFLGAATWLCAMAPFPAAAQQKADEADRSADLRAARKQPPTILATPAFFLHTSPPPRILCSAVNLGSTPRDVTITLRAMTIFGIPPISQTITLQPNAIAGLDVGGGSGSPVLPIRAFCEFQSSDVTLIRASASVFQGTSGVPEFTPAN